MIAIARYFVFMISVTATISFANVIEDDRLVPFILQMLAKHNNTRIKHGAQSLLLSNQLCEEAKKIRNKINNNQLHLIPSDIGWNQDRGQFHEILDNQSILASTIFSKWYNTGVGYDFENDPSAGSAISTAPFTQIVWKATTSIGISLLATYEGNYDAVVVYSPKGNQINQYQSNVSQRRN